MRYYYFFIFFFLPILANGQEVTIGSGTNQTVSLPVDCYYQYTYSQTIYKGSDVGYSGDITGLKFYMPSGANIDKSKDWVVSLGVTTKTVFASKDDWLTIGNLTQVFNGTVSNSNGVVSITFSAYSFDHTTQNLVIAVDENTSGKNGVNDGFYVHSAYPSVCIGSIGNTNADPSSPPTANVQYGYRANVTIVGIGPSCSPPTDLSASNLAPTSATLNWIASVFDPLAAFDWEVRTSGVGGSGPTGLVASGSVGSGILQADVSGLSTNTTYSFYVRSNCGSGDYSTWTASPSFTTEAWTAIPWSEPFVNVSTPTGWKINLWTIGSVFNGNPNNNIYKHFYSGATSGHFSTINVRTVVNGNVLSFDYKAGNYYYPYGPPAAGSGSFVVSLSTDYGENYSDLATITNDGVDGWRSWIYDLSSYAGEDVKIKITGTWVSGDWYLGFDNFKIETPPTCFPSTTLSTSDITESSATISWNIPSPAPSNGYEYYYATNSTPPNSPGTHESGTSVNLMNLSANTTYYWWVRSDCGGGDFSTWSGPEEFYTGYCPVTSTSTTNGIIEFTTDYGINNISKSSAVAPYSDFSSLSASQFAGGDITFAITPDVTKQGMAIWVDWNDNLLFDVSEKMYSSNGKVASGTGTFTVPNGTPNGDYRMRVVSNYLTGYPTACGDLGYANAGEAEDYTFSVVNAPPDAMDWCNTQNPGNGNIEIGENLTVYSQGHESGVTNSSGQGSGITVWVGINTSNIDPSQSGWTWKEAIYNIDVGNNDEYKQDIGADLSPGTYYYAFRWQLNNGVYKYGGYSSGGGGFWDGTTYVNGALTVNPISNDDCSGAISLTVTNEMPTQPVLGNMNGATPSTEDFSGSSCNSYSSDNDIWYKATVPSSGKINIETFVTGGTSNASNDYSLQVYTGVCGNLNYLNCNEDGDSGDESPTDFMPKIALTGLGPNSTLFIRIRKSNASSQKIFTIAAYNPDGLLSIATSDCSSGGTVNITKANGNAYRWVPLLDADGHLIAQISPHGNELGNVITSINRNTGAVRKDQAGVFYLDRDFTISVENQPTTPCDIRLFFTDTEWNALNDVDNSVNNLSQLNATKFSNRCGKAPGSGGVFLTQTGNLNRSDNSHAVSFSPASFSTFYIHAGNTPLPVTLMEFTATATNKQAVLLRWKVAEEVDVKEYIVERSSNAKDFIPIGSALAARKDNYQLIDASPVSGANYYKLKIVDQNGTVNYSPIRQVTFNSNHDLTLFPNPSSGVIYITGIESAHSVVNILILNEYGQSVWSAKMSEMEMAEKGMDLHQLKSGIYTVQVTTEDRITNLRFIKI